jgi:Family of unknown function (DUF5906)
VPPPAAEPPIPDAVKNLWRWAKGYISQFGWAIAPVWMPVAAVPGAAGAGLVGCCCKEGEACTTWGKHLVSGLGVARVEEDVERVFPASDLRVKAGWIGLAVLTGSESKIVVLDVGEHAEMTRARFKMTGHVLTQTTPSGGQHWFFRIGESDAVMGGRTEIELVTGVWVLGDGAFAVLAPRPGYEWSGGSKVLVDPIAGLTDATSALMMRLTAAGLVDDVARIDRDDPWRTRPGTPLVGGDPRTYTRRGDVRRLIDTHGDKMLFTPGLSWRVWTESGWGGPERSETMLKSYCMDMPDTHLAEGRASKLEGKDTLSKDAFKWAGKAQQRPTASILGDLQSDERVLVPSALNWDAEGWIAGLPVTAGIGRLVNLKTGECELDARTRRVSKALGAPYDDGPGGEFKHLWDVASEGGQGRWFHKFVTDLEHQMGPDNLRLLQRAAGASLYGRRGVDGDVDAVFVLKGPTRSGKSTFSEILLKVVGSYGKAMSHNLLFGDKGNPDFSVAAIVGQRVLTFSEPPMKAEVNLPMLKSLSGGDSLSGRLPYGKEEISFVPECSLWLSTNHALEIPDEAVWRRLKFFPFEYSMSEREVIPDLRSQITRQPAELRLALAWMLEGAKAWNEHGWGDTSAWAETATDERAKHNIFAKWAGACLEVTGNALDTFTHADLVVSFNTWVMFAGEDAPKLSKAAVRDELENTCRTLRMTYDKKRKLMVGGRLI